LGRGVEESGELGWGDIVVRIGMAGVESYFEGAGILVVETFFEVGAFKCKVHLRGNRAILF